MNIVNTLPNENGWIDHKIFGKNILTHKMITRVTQDGLMLVYHWNFRKTTQKVPAFAVDTYTMKYKYIGNLDK